MTRTTITKTNNHTVILRAIDPMTDEPIEREFWIPRSGGYVREGDKQVCRYLDFRGDTLTARDADDLLRTIRSEWAAYRRWAKSQHTAI